MRIVVAAVFFACAAAPTPFSPEAARPELACASQIIVMFSEPLARDPDEALVKNLANAAEIRLVYLRSAGPGLYVFALAGDEPDPRCKDALERLRRDSRVRSAELDARRKPQLTHL